MITTDRWQNWGAQKNELIPDNETNMMMKGKEEETGFPICIGYIDIDA